MSMGFIIALVFAIVLLSLALVWLQGLFGDLTGLTTDLTQEAQTILRDTFSQTSSSFGVWPPEYSLDPGRGLRLSAGIENDAGDGRDHLFVINVIPSSADDNILSANGCSAFETCPQLEEKMKSWVTFDKSAGIIQINTLGFKFIEVKPATDSVKGVYFFNVVACYDEVIGATPVSDLCTPVADNIWGGSAQPLLIRVV